MSAPYGQYYGQPYGQQYGQPYGQGPQMPMPNQYGQGYYQPPPQNYYNQSQEQKINVSNDKPSSSSSKPDKNDSNDFKKSKIEFNEKPKYQDLWATFVYLAVVAVTVVIAVMNIPNMDLDRLNDRFNKTGKNSSNKYSNNKYSSYNKRANDNKLDAKAVIILVGASLGSSALLTLFYMILVQKFTGKMIKGTFFLSIILNFVYAALLIFSKQLIMGVIMLIFSFLYVLCYFFWKGRIPFAKVMLKTVTSVTKKFPATIFVGFIGCILAILWYGFIGFTLIAALCSEKAQENEVVGYVIYVFLIFSFFYSSQVINNTVHVTISGVFATYYFRGAIEPGTNKIEVDVKNPTLSSLKRATTTSFGSICFGSLLIAIVSTLRVIANNVKHDSAEDGEILLTILACCVECILACIEDGIEYFNVYAYTEVAIYGKSYCQAAKDTWTLCKARGIEALINDNIIGNVLVIGQLAVGCLAAAVTFGIGMVMFELELVLCIIFTVIAFFVGLMIFSVVAQVINSGVATTFVCLCEDPDALRQTKPELWEKVRDTYPSIVY